MSNAYNRLNIPDTADDDTIRRAYLTMIQQFPPDLYPDEFQEIRAAYDGIKDARSRAHYAIVHTPDVTLNELFASAMTPDQARRPSLDLMLRCIKASL